MYRSFFILFFSSLLSLGLYGQPLGFSLANGKKKVQIPIQIYSNLIVVPVVLNNTLPLKFILDTGVRTTILTQKAFTDILNLQYSRKYTISGAGGENLIDAYITNNVSLSMPGVESRGHAMLVLEKDYLELRNYLGTDVHGILGYELFSRFIVDVDYEKKLLTLIVPEKSRKYRNFQSIPIKIEDTKPYLITTVTLDDGTTLSAKLLVDTGASHALLLDPFSDNRIHVPEKVLSSLIGRGLGGEIYGKIGRIENLQLGSYNVHSVVTNFPDPNSYFDSLKVGKIFRNGSIGGELMSRFHMVYDFPEEKIFFKKNASFKKGFHHNLSGLTIKAKGVHLNIFEITEVRDESAAKKAGLEVGDIIENVGGITLRDLNLSLVNGLLNNKPGKKVKVEVNRKGVRVKSFLILADQI
ncbi:MAG TPA: aspartyl protease family protein [Chryseolinea sp.]|nr:aspartyl protease family protein [Chryseolinea sp.]HPH45573.1 aspartyl protease family protein [Chryseolinea sp.]HPM28995.1 aspartyl protease family protein [Chryseolinea sp.]